MFQVIDVDALGQVGFIRSFPTLEDALKHFQYECTLFVHDNLNGNLMSHTTVRIADEHNVSVIESTIFVREF